MKRRYTTWQNIIFTHQYLLQGVQVKYWLETIAILVGSILTTFMLTYLPAYAVDLLLHRGNLGVLFGRIVVYSLLLCVSTVLYKRIERNVDKMVNNRRMIKKGEDYYTRIAKTNYETIDRSDYKAYFHAGLVSFYDGPHQGFHYMMFDFRTLLMSVIGFVVYAIFIAGVDLSISIFLLVVSSLSIVASVFHEKWITKHQEKWFALDAKIRYLSKESIALKNAKDIRLYKIKDWLIDSFHLLVSLRQNWLKKELRVLFLVNLSARLLTALKYTVAYFIAFENVKNGLPVQSFILLIGLILGVNQWVSNLFTCMKHLQLNSIHVDNTRKVLDLEQPLEDQTEQIWASGQPLSIQLIDVTFLFPETKVPIFEHLNLNIVAGEKLAIVGNNGAGKSTLIKLICGLYRPTSGKILINGVDVSRMDRERVYRCFSVVFQDFNLLAASIAENVACCPADQADIDCVKDCIQRAGLAEKVESLPRGLASNLLKELDLDGIVLSGGEKQKLMIARCLYKNSPAMILDEPTSALDALAESEIYEHYNTLSADKTSIFISHRLSSTKFCDRIILMEHGKILEEGTHDELLQKGDTYAHMYAIQSSYYR